MPSFTNIPCRSGYDRRLWSTCLTCYPHIEGLGGDKATPVVVSKPFPTDTMRVMAPITTAGTYRQTGRSTSAANSIKHRWGLGFSGKRHRFELIWECNVRCWQTAARGCLLAQQYYNTYFSSWHKLYVSSKGLRSHRGRDPR